jgi:hypothetical protein
MPLIVYHPWRGWFSDVDFYSVAIRLDAGYSADFENLWRFVITIERVVPYWPLAAT